MSALPAGVAKDAPTPVASGESRRPLSIVLIQTGSRGDVQPFCLLGQALHAAGHSVAIAAEARHEAYVRSFGLAFRLIAGDCNAWQTEAALVQKSHAGAGGVMAFLALLKDYRHRAAPVEAFLASIASAAEGADLIVSGALNAAEATCAAEATGAAFAFVGLIPWLSYTSDYGLPIVSPALLSCRWSRTFNRLVWDTVIQSGWRDLAAHVNAWRVGSLGLPTCTHPGGPFTELVEPQSKSPRAPATVITAGSALLCIDGRPASDWGAKWPLVGPFLAPLPAEPPPAALEAFLQDAGADARPVVYLGFGSMRNPRPAALASLIIAACTAGGVRGILVEGWSDLGSEASQAILRPAVTARTILVVKEVSHTWLFPRVAAIVHHCGVGTANAALASGAPQILVPHLLDQPLNASLIIKLGCAPCILPIGSLTAENLGAVLRRAAHPGPERSALLAAAGRAAGIISREAAGSLRFAVEALEGAWADWERRRTQAPQHHRDPSESRSAFVRAAAGKPEVPSRAKEE